MSFPSTSYEQNLMKREKTLASFCGAKEQAQTLDEILNPETEESVGVLQDIADAADLVRFVSGRNSCLHLGEARWFARVRNIRISTRHRSCTLQLSSLSLFLSYKSHHLLFG